MRFQKTVIINPPSPAGYVANRDSMGGFGQLFPPSAATPPPPMDFPYLAGYLERAEVPLEAIEADGLELSRKQVVEQVAKIARADERHRILVVVRTSAPTLDWDLEICNDIKVNAPTIGLGIYGPVVPHVLHRLQREQCLDYIIQGEPDETVAELTNNSDIGQIRGLAHRVDDRWVQGSPRPFKKELDELPFPKWELMPYRRYAIPRSSTSPSLPFLPVLSSRGCPFGCHYCPYPVGQGLAWRFRSPQNVVDEVEHLVNDLGIQYILFRDPMFSLRLSRVKEICDQIQKRGIKVKWKCETRPDCLDEETVKAMAAAGCDGVNFGVESAEPEIQANVGRKVISRERIIEIVARCRRHGIKTFCFFIIGLPGDTVETILETIHFAIRLRANWIQFTAASPFIGTRLRDWAVAEGLATEDEYSYISSHIVLMGNDNLSKYQIERLHRFAKVFERYLINRGGILKDDNRRGFLYSGARWMADLTAGVAAKILFNVGRRRFPTAVASASDA